MDLRRVLGEYPRPMGAMREVFVQEDMLLSSRNNRFYQFPNILYFDEAAHYLSWALSGMLVTIHEKKRKTWQERGKDNIYSNTFDTKSEDKKKGNSKPKRGNQLIKRSLKCLLYSLSCLVPLNVSVVITKRHYKCSNKYWVYSANTHRCI